MEKKHADEKKVQQFLNLSNGSAKRRLIQKKLRREWNFRYNKNVLDTKKGTVIPEMRKAVYSSTTADDYIPCIHCKGLLRRIIYGSTENDVFSIQIQNQRGES